MQGIEELETLEKLCQATGIEIIDFDPTLARGLDYYTGCIFEVKPDDGSMDAAPPLAQARRARQGPRAAGSMSRSC